MLSNHLEKEPAENQVVMVNVTVWAVKDESCLIAGFPEQIKLDMPLFFYFFFYEQVSSVQSKA